MILQIIECNLTGSLIQHGTHGWLAGNDELFRPVPLPYN